MAASIVTDSKRYLLPNGAGNESIVKILMTGVTSFTFTYAELGVSYVFGVINCGTAATSTGGDVWFDGTNVAGANFSNGATVTLKILHA